MYPNPQLYRNKTFQTGRQFIGEARISGVCENENWEEFGSEDVHVQTQVWQSWDIM